MLCNSPTVVLFHAKRVLGWRLTNVDPTVRENRQLDQSGVIPNKTVRSYMVWRQSMLCAALPSVLLSSILAFLRVVELSADETEIILYNTFGRIVNAMPDIAQIINFPAVVLVVLFWRNLNKSKLVVSAGWCLSLILPLWPTLIPADALFKDEFDSTMFGDGLGLFYRALAGLEYLIRILPIILTLPFGSIKGALRIRGLLPYSSLAGFSIVQTAPYLSVLLFAALMLLIQIAGNGLLIVGALLLTLSPMLYLFNADLYTNAKSEEDEDKLDRAQRKTGLISLLGILLIVIWAFTYEQTEESRDEEGNQIQIKIHVVGDPTELDTFPFISYSDVAMFVFQAIGLNLFTTVMVADRILHQSVENWHSTMLRRLVYESADVTNEEFHQLVVKKIDSGNLAEKPEEGSEANESLHTAADEKARDDDRPEAAADNGEELGHP